MMKTSEHYQAPVSTRDTRCQVVQVSSLDTQFPPIKFKRNAEIKINAFYERLHLFNES